MLITADHHTHTTLCKHATGSMEAYVERAIQLGLKAIGFADHNPLPNGWGADVRMSESELDGYVNRVLDLRVRYQGRIKVLLGMEMDYVEGLESYLAGQQSRYPWDYVIGAIHYLDRDCELISWPRKFAGDPAWLYGRYFELMGKLVHSGLCDIIAHFDVPKRSGCAPDHAQADLIAGILWQISQAGLCMEINTSGCRHPELAQPEPYPSLTILDQVLAMKIPLTVNSDAHAPEQVGLKFAEMEELLQARGCDQVFSFEKRQRV